MHPCPLPGNLVGYLNTTTAKISSICPVTISHVSFCHPTPATRSLCLLSSFPILPFNPQACYRYSYRHSFHQKILRASVLPRLIPSFNSPKHHHPPILLLFSAPHYCCATSLALLLIPLHCIPHHKTPHKLLHCPSAPSPQLRMKAHLSRLPALPNCPSPTYFHSYATDGSAHLQSKFLIEQNICILFAAIIYFNADLKHMTSLIKYQTKQNLQKR